MDIITAESFTHLIPDLAMFFIPFMVFSGTYCFLAQKKCPVEKFFSVNSMLYSFIISILGRQIFHILGWKDSGDASVIIFSAVCGTICGLIETNQYIGTHIIEPIFHRTLDRGVWDGISDKDKGCYIDVFLKDGISYSGVYFKYYTSDEGDTWLVLSDVVMMNHGAVCRDFDMADDPTWQAVINTKNVDRIHVKYSKDSDRILR